MLLRTSAIAALLLSAPPASAAQKPLTVDSFETTDGSISIVVQGMPAGKSRAKCAVKDAAGKYIAVDDEQVSSPVDQVIILTNKARSAETIECWIEEQ